MSQSVSNLPKCFICNNFLSFFPIRQTRDLNLICGRCPEGDTILDLRYNLTFERAVVGKKFPCRYHHKGCKEILRPPQVPTHERQCNFKEISCPTVLFNIRCKWTGLNEQLVQHCQSLHHDLFAKNDSVELDLTKNYRCLMFVKHKQDNVFLVNLSVVSKSDLKIIVFPCGQLAAAKNMSAKITIEVQGVSLLGIIDLFKRTLIDLRSITDESAVSKICVQIQVCPNISLSREKIDIKKLLPDIECQVCCTSMIPPVYLCDNGHTVCGICRSNTYPLMCPYCRKSVTHHENLALETFINLPVHSCKYSCNFVANYAFLVGHEIFCLRRDDNFEYCLFAETSGCVVTGSKKFLLTHMAAVHTRNFFRSNTVQINSKDIELNVLTTFAIVYLERLFCLKLLLNHSFLHMSMGFNGFYKDRNMFKYNFEIRQDDKLLLQGAGQSLGEDKKVGIRLDVLVKANVSLQDLTFKFTIVK